MRPVMVGRHCPGGPCLSRFSWLSVAGHTVNQTARAHVQARERSKEVRREYGAPHRKARGERWGRLLRRLLGPSFGRVWLTGRPTLRS